MISRLLKKFHCRYGAAVFFAALLVTCGVSSAQTASVTKDEMVALSDYGGGKVIVAYPRALYQIDISARKRLSLSLPAPVDRITAVAIAVNKEGRIYIAAKGSGVWRSDDGGKTWKIRSEGLPNKEITALASHAKQSDTLYAYLPGDGIYRSENAGDSWQLMDAGPEDMTNTFIHSDMAGSMQTGWLFAATKAGISRSMDCFCLWRDAGRLAGTVYGLTHDPRHPAHLYAATDKGVFRSRNGGEDWEKTNAPDSFVTALAFTTAGELYAGTTDDKLYRSVDQAVSWERIDGLW